MQVSKSQKHMSFLRADIIKQKHEKSCLKKCISRENQCKDIDMSHPDQICRNVDVHGEILVVTWNINTCALVENDLHAFFDKQIQQIQPKIIVFSLQEVSNAFFNFIPRKLQEYILYSNRLNDILDMDIIHKYFEEKSYAKIPAANLHSNNQLTVVYYKIGSIQIQKIYSTVLTSNSKKTKGAMAISLEYKDPESADNKHVCFISAHLSAHSDHENNAFFNTRHKYFLKRVDEMYNLLQACDIWYKKITNSTDKTFLPFNIILEGDLNFRMILDMQTTFFDEGGIILQDFEFEEIEKKFRQTFKVQKNKTRHTKKNTDDFVKYDSSRQFAWTDRISFHNTPKKRFILKQKSYNILRQSKTVSDHLPVYSVFDFEVKSNTSST